jgi:hypothetical protein
MPNQKPIILDLCGGTGAWSKPYKNANYDVRVVTLPEQDVNTYLPPNNVYGILAAPPCTMFSLARTTAKTPRNFNLGMMPVKACMKIIWGAQESGSLNFWALENPRGLLRRFLGHPAFHFEQWEYGDIGIKPTDLWGFFKNPKKQALKRPASLTQKFKNGSINAKGWSGTAEKRAITPPGFAQAFFEANQ